MVEKKKYAALNKTANLNLALYSNLLVEYSETKEIDSEEIVDDIRFWREVLKKAELTPSEKKEVEVKKKADEKKNEVALPEGIERLEQCPKCTGKNMVFKTGKNKTTGKEWFAFDCQDCKTANNGNDYPTRTFVNKVKTPSKTNVSETEFEDSEFDGEDVPF